MITGANNEAGSIRVDWEYYFEGYPDYSVYDQYLPVESPKASNGVHHIVGMAPHLVKKAAITRIDEGYQGTSSN